MKALQTLHYFATTALCDDGTNRGLQCETGLPHTSASTNELQTILQLTFGFVAALTVLMIVIAGFKFISAQGNPQETAKARQTIIYAAAGLVVAISAEIIVGFALGRVK